MLSTTPHTRAVRFAFAAGALSEAELLHLGLILKALASAYGWEDFVAAIQGCTCDLS